MAASPWVCQAAAEIGQLAEAPKLGNLLWAPSPHLSPQDRSFQTPLSRSQRCVGSSEQLGASCSKQ